MPYERPVVLRIAGYDPSGGAGVLADVKTFEQYQCLGMAAVTAWTVQTEDRFFRLESFTLNEIREQVEPLLDRYAIRWIKIGLCPEPQLLLALLTGLKDKYPEVRIVWDPVLAASTGFSFTGKINHQLLENILHHVFLITPNIREAQELSGCSGEQEPGAWLAQCTHVLLKGGHSDLAPGRDILFTEGQETMLYPRVSDLYPKHGSGCILSAAITAGLASGKPLEQACREAKTYIETILSSNANLLAYHHV